MLERLEPLEREKPDKPGKPDKPDKPDKPFYTDILLSLPVVILFLKRGG
ncbi:MAG TPA: hypothetical protein PLR60_03515 [Syntrophorhabdaceae bacterium]|nr:hypothetical protein [Syntrophorhabdaceae bacterium]